MRAGFRYLLKSSLFKIQGLSKVKALEDSKFIDNAEHWHHTKGELQERCFLGTFPKF